MQFLSAYPRENIDRLATFLPQRLFTSAQSRKTRKEPNIAPGRPFQKGASINDVISDAIDWKPSSKWNSPKVQRPKERTWKNDFTRFYLNCAETVHNSRLEHSRNEETILAERGMRNQSVQTDISIGKDARDFEELCLGHVYGRETAKQIALVILMNQLDTN